MSMAPRSPAAHLARSVVLDENQPVNRLALVQVAHGAALDDLAGSQEASHSPDYESLTNSQGCGNSHELIG